jgi:membrane protein implicated in regulation of membrane protease activity
MDWLKSYYDLSPFFFTVTASASVLFTVANLSFLFGADGAEDALAASTEVHHVASETAFQYFSTQTVLAFLLGFGWAGLTATIKWKLPVLVAAGVGVAFGAALMVFTAFLLSRVRRLDHTTRATVFSALGSRGTVYTAVGPAGTGQVQVQVGGQLKIVAAVTGGEEIGSFTEIEVIGIKDHRTVIVRPLAAPAGAEEE